jgi:hypothetical protein
MELNNSDLNYTFSTIKPKQPKMLDESTKKMLSKMEKYQNLSSGVLGDRGKLKQQWNNSTVTNYNNSRMNTITSTSVTPKKPEQVCINNKSSQKLH